MTESTVALIRVIAGATLFVVLWSLEARWAAPVDPHQRRRHAIANLSMATFNAAVLYFSVGVVTLGWAAWAAEHRWGLLLRDSWCGQLPEWTKWTLALIALDVTSYAWHRLNHVVPFLWRFHQVHHSDAAMDASSAARFHVGEMFMAAWFRLPWILLLGISPMIIIVYETVLVCVSLFHHSRLRLGTSERWLRWLVVTPEMHDIHHRRSARDAMHNFASVLSVWDRLFRTHRPTALSINPQTGVDGLDNPESQSFTGMLRMPFQRRTEQQRR